MKKLFKFYHLETWEIIKIEAETAPKAKNLFKQQNPDKNIKDYGLIPPKKEVTKITTQSFSEWEGKELRK